MAPGPAELTLGALADMVGGRVFGDTDLRVSGIATLEYAGPGELGFLADGKYLSKIPESLAGGVLVSEALDAEATAVANRVVVENAHQALSILIEYFHPEPERRAEIHPTAVIGEGVTIGVEASVGPYVVIEDGATIGDRATLHAHVVVRREARLGDDVLLHPHVVIYPQAQVGHRVVLHAGVRIGVDGFGYTPTDEGLRKIPHVGACVIGDDVEIGANSCVDRGSIGRTELRSQTKLDNLVHIAHNVFVGPRSVMAALVGIAGSTSIGADTMWGGQSGAVDHIQIGDRVRVAGKAGLSNDVPSGSTMAGWPARPLKDFLQANAALYRLASLRRRVLDMDRRVLDMERTIASARGEDDAGE